MKLDEFIPDTRRVTASLVRAATAGVSLLLVVAATHAAAAEPEEAPLRRFWFDFGLGAGSLSTNASAPAGSGGGGLSVDAQVGARLSRRWLIGFGLSGIGRGWSNSNYDPNDAYSNVYDQTLNTVFWVTQFEPKKDHGWFVGAGAGTTTYTDKQMTTAWGQAASGGGHGKSLRVGYDWRLRPPMHINASLSFGSGDISLDAPFSGRFNYSLTVLAAHVSF